MQLSCSASRTLGRAKLRNFENKTVKKLLGGYFGIGLGGGAAGIGGSREDLININGVTRHNGGLGSGSNNRV